MPQVLNSDAELAGKRLHTTDATLTNTFAGLSTLTGSVRISGQPHCRLRNNVVQPISHATYTALSFDTELGDIGGMHSSVNPTRVTIPSGQGGLYIVSGSCEFAANSTGSRFLKFRVNGVDAGPRVKTDTSHATASMALAITNVLLLSPGDFVELFAQQTSGVVLNVGNPDPQASTTLYAVKLS